MTTQNIIIIVAVGLIAASFYLFIRRNKKNSNNTGTGSGGYGDE